MNIISSVTSDIISSFGQVKIIDDLLQVGSSIDLRNYQDLDFICLSNEPELAKSEVLSRSSFSILGEIDGSVRLQADQIEIGIVFWNTLSTINKIKNTLEDPKPRPRYREWALGAMLPEALIGDIWQAKSLLQENSTAFRELKSLISDRRDVFLNNVFRTSLDELEMRVAQYAQAIKAEDQLASHAAQTHIILMIVRCAYAKQGVFLQGLKHAVDRMSDFDDPLYAAHLAEILDLNKTDNQKYKGFETCLTHYRSKL